MKSRKSPRRVGPPCCGVGRHTLPRIGAKIRDLCPDARRRHSNEKQISMTPPEKSTIKLHGPTNGSNSEVHRRLLRKLFPGKDLRQQIGASQ